MTREGTLTQGDIANLTRYSAAGVRAALAENEQIKPVYRHAKLCLYSPADLPEIKKTIEAFRAKARERMIEASRKNLQAAKDQRAAKRAPAPAPAPAPAAPRGPDRETVALIDQLLAENLDEVDKRITRSTEMLTQQHRILMKHIEDLHKLVAKLVGELQGETTT